VGEILLSPCTAIQHCNLHMIKNLLHLHEHQQQQFLLQKKRQESTVELNHKKQFKSELI